MGHAWFSEVTPQLWLGGAPTYGRDFDEILAMGITGVVDMRAEREAEAEFFAEHEIAHRQYFVPDVTVPDEEILTDAVGRDHGVGRRGADGADPLRQGTRPVRHGPRRVPHEDRGHELRRR